MLKERPFKATSGWPVLAITLLILVAAVYLFVNNIVGANSGGHFSPVKLFSSLGLLAAFIISLPGFQAIPPNAARVLLLFGSYKGTVTTSGFYWVNPFFSKKKLSLRVRNFETGSTRTAYWRMGLEPMNVAASMGIPTFCEISTMGRMSASRVRAAQLGTSASFWSTISFARRSTCFCTCGPAPGKPIFTA